MKQKNEELENALQCADRNKAEKQGDSHHHPSLELGASCVVKSSKANSHESSKAVRKHVLYSMTIETCEIVFCFWP